MVNFIGKLRRILDRLTHATPPERPITSRADWLPPMIGASDLSSPYFLAMADRDATWYFDRR